MNLEWMIGIDLQGGKIQLDPSLLRVVRIDIHDSDDDVVAG